MYHHFTISVFWGFFVLFLSKCDPVICSSEQIVTQPIYDYLFANYTRNLLPTCRGGNKVTLRMDIALRQIIDLNEPEQILTTNIWMRLNWNDCRLMWNSSDFDNLTYVTVLYEDVWIPDITLYDSAASADTMFPGRKEYRAFISSSGSVSYNFPTIMISICAMNVKYFPFDTQTCTLKFGSWSHHGFELDIVNKNPNGDSDMFITNNEWIIEGFPAQRNELFYNCCPEPYPDVTYSVILKRRPEFYVTTMLFPCVLVTFVAGLTFLLPTESGEKVSLEITVLLSLSVFLLLVSEALPPASDNFPIIGIYFATSMVLVTLSLVQTVLVVNLYHRGKNGRKVPGFLRVFFFKFLGRVLCAKRGADNAHPWRYEQSDDIPRVEDIHIKIPKRQSTDFDMNQNQSPPNKTVLIDSNGGPDYHVGKDTIDTTQLMKEQLTVLKSIADTNRENLRATDITEWMDISNITDRLFLIIYSLVSILTAVIFIAQMMTSE